MSIPSAISHEYVVDLKYNETAIIVITSDLHIGAKESRFDLFEERILQRHAGNTRVLYLMIGDMINCIAPGDPRYRLSETHELFKNKDNTHQAETMYYIELLKKYEIPPQFLLGHVVGNHEDAALKHNNYDPFIDLVHHLRSPYLGIDGFLKVTFRAHGGTLLPLVFYYHHGTGGGSRRKGSGAQLEKYINYSFPYRGADIYCFAHEHALADDRVVIHKPVFGHDRVMRREILYVNSGTYLGEEGYARRKMYSPKPLGHVELRVTPKRRNISKRRYNYLDLQVQKHSWVDPTYPLKA